MLRFLLILLCVCGLAYVSYQCVQTKSPEIEVDIAQRAHSFLKNAGIDWARLSVDGRNVEIEGLAPNEDAAKEAIAALRNRFGIGRVADEITISPTTSRPPIPDSYSFTLNYNGNNVEISGLVPDEITLNGVMKGAQRRFGETNVSATLDTSFGAPAGWEDVLMRVVLPSVRGFKNVKMTLENRSLNIDGVVSTPALKERLEKTFQNALPENYEFSFDVEAEGQDKVVHLSARQCQDFFKVIMAKSSLFFMQGKAIVHPQWHPMLKRMASIAQQCPQTTIEIIGYTDAQGDASTNRRLSLQRAQTVADYLRLAGVEAKRLSISGRGEESPLATNATAAGRAQNRRIEFIVREAQEE